MDGSAVLLLLRATVSLVVVLGLIVWASRVVERRLGGAHTRRLAVPVTVLARQSLSRHASLSVVQVGGEVLVLGVTDAQVSLLTDLDPASLQCAVDAVEDPTASARAVAGEATPGAPAPQDVAQRPDFAQVLRGTVALPLRREITSQSALTRAITHRFTGTRDQGGHRD